MTPAAFFERPASAGWEIVPISGVADVNCWAWFRPGTLPAGVAVTIPPDVIGLPGAVLPFSLVQLIHAVGLTWDQLVSVSFYGEPWQSAAFCQATAAEFLPCPPAVANVQILLMAGQQTLAVPQPQPTAHLLSSEAEVFVPSQAVTSQFHRLETGWKACQGMERQLAGLRQQLSGVLGRLGALDRDLRPAERMGAARQEKDEWQDTRRWIRDAASKVQRCLKAHDIGVTSAAGRRNMIQERYEQSSGDVDGFTDLTSCLHEVESYRKELANLFNNMGSTLQGANANGIQRAQRVLSKISAQASKKRVQDRGRP